MEWHEAVDEIAPHIVQITSPRGSGTGFFLYRTPNRTTCAIATAAHVVDHAHYWEQPIRIRLPEQDEESLVRPSNRAIFIDAERDTAVVLFDATQLSLPEEPHQLIEEGFIYKVGVQIGWLGFPAMPSAGLCFFGGSISAWQQHVRAYFVDGVAINGVSGGPAFSCIAEPVILGVVSAYMPNRATGETLPGLAVVRDVSQLRDVVKNFQSLEEAQAEETSPEAPPSPRPSKTAGAPDPTGSW